MENIIETAKIARKLIEQELKIDLDIEDQEVTTFETPSADALKSYIDHTVLKANVVSEDIKKLCREAKDLSLFSVCVNPNFVSLAKESLSGSPVKVCTVADFPLGAKTPATRIEEVKLLISEGADEIDIVASHQLLLDQHYEKYMQDLKDIADLCRENSVLFKVIIETDFLDSQQIAVASYLVRLSGADFIKTSTGFFGDGAQLEDISLMRYCVGSKIGVKASGGIRDLDRALAMVQSGASRIGASSSVKFFQDL